MRISPKLNGRVIEGKTKYGDFNIVVDNDYDGPIFDYNGNKIGQLKLTMKMPTISLPPQLVEIGFDPSVLKTGGCCDPPRIKENTP